MGCPSVQEPSSVPSKCSSNSHCSPWHLYRLFIKYQLESREHRNYLIQVLYKNEKPWARVERHAQGHSLVPQGAGTQSPISWPAPGPGLFLTHHSAIYTMGPRSHAKTTVCIVWKALMTQLIQQDRAVCFYCKTCSLYALHFGSRKKIIIQRSCNIY